MTVHKVIFLSCLHVFIITVIYLTPLIGPVPQWLEVFLSRPISSANETQCTEFCLFGFWVRSYNSISEVLLHTCMIVACVCIQERSYIMNNPYSKEKISLFLSNSHKMDKSDHFMIIVALKRVKEMQNN